MNPPRPVIAHVLHRLYLAGAEVLAAALARQLRDRFTFVFLCLDEVGPLGQQLQTEGFTVLDLQRRPGVDLGVAKRLLAAVGEHHIQLLHAHQYTPFFYAAASRLPPVQWGGAGRGPAILFTEHGRHYPDVRKTKRVLANQFLLRRRDRVTAVGEWVKSALVNNEGLPQRRIEVIHNGIAPPAPPEVSQIISGGTPSPLGPDTSTRAAVRAELQLAPAAVAVTQVARFHPVKDHETCLRAWALVLEQWPAAATPPVLLLVGDGERRSQLETLAQHLHIDHAVRFLGVRQDVSRLLTGCDVFVLSSLSEGISVTLLEAMAAGLPIAATAVGGNGEVVLDQVTGLLSPRQDPPALAQNLLRLIQDANLRQRYGSAGRARMLQHFTQDRMHRRYAELYEQMLGISPSPSGLRL